MSVLIKGMEMPHDCDSCKVSDILDCPLWKPMDIGERHPECPLVEVPTPHGRLTDADKFNEFIEKYCTDSLSDLWKELVRRQPTVIEAEGE